MDKKQRIAQLKKQYKKFKENSNIEIFDDSDYVLPPKKDDLKDELDLLDSVREENRDHQTDSEFLTSDEKF